MRLSRGGPRRIGHSILAGVAALCVAIAASLVPLPAQAAERASITASGTMAYSGGEWVAVGGVRLVQGDLEVRAERMRYIVDEDRVEFSENVRVRRDESEITASAFVYDLAASTGRIVDGVAAIEVEEFKGPLYVLGDSIDFGSGRTTVENARLTTCEPPGAAGYYLIARRMDIFPDDKVVIRSVRFVESGLTLFYWPYLSISLDPNKRSRFSLPEVGHNPTDGWYIKTRFGYDGPGEGGGEIALDIMQHTGIGTGVHHVYREDEESQGSVTVYHLRAYDGSSREWRLGWDESFKLGSSIDVGWRTAYVDRASLGDRSREGWASLALDRSVGSTITSLDWERQQYWDENPGSADRFRLTHRARPLGWNWRLSGDAAIHNRDGLANRHVLSYTSSLERSTGPFDLRLDIEDRAHPSWLSGSSSAPLWKQRARLPELSVGVDLDAVVPFVFPVDAQLAYGRLREERRVPGGYETVTADRATVGFSLQPASFDLGRLGQLQSRAGATWQGYSTGERRLILSADHQYYLRLSPSLSLYGSYSYREPFGDESPFVFDAEGYREQVTGRLQLTRSGGSFVLSSGYDFGERRFMDVVAQATARLGTGVFGSVQAGYSLAEQAPSFAAASVSIQASEHFELTASTRYDFLTRSLEDVDMDLTAAYLGWRLSYAAAYDQEDGWSQGDVALVRDLGCREIGLRLDQIEGAVWLEYRIDALPGEGIRFGASQDRFLFDPDTITSLF